MPVCRRHQLPQPSGRGRFRSPRRFAASAGVRWTIAADVSDSAAVARMVSEVQAGLGPIDILINNAGIALIRGIDDLTEAEFDETIAVNLKSVFLCTEAVLHRAQAQGGSSPSRPARRAGRAASDCTTTHRRPAWRA